MGALVEGVVPGALPVSDEYDGLFFDGGVNFAFTSFDDGCEDFGWVGLFGPCFIVAEEEVGDSLYRQSKLIYAMRWVMQCVGLVNEQRCIHPNVKCHNHSHSHNQL